MLGFYELCGREDDLRCSCRLLSLEDTLKYYVKILRIWVFSWNISVVVSRYSIVGTLIPGKFFFSIVTRNYACMVIVQMSISIFLHHLVRFTSGGLHFPWANCKYALKPFWCGNQFNQQQPTTVIYIMNAINGPQKTALVFFSRFQPTFSVSQLILPNYQSTV
jgi:hypothetical protein